MFEWMSEHPEDLGHFNRYMTLSRKLSGRSWLDVYPVAAEAADWPAEQPLFVDAGGALGHQCAKFKEEFPNLKGRVVLQDLPHTIQRALCTPGVENMVHDLFDPQPVIGTFETLRCLLSCWHVNSTMCELDLIENVFIRCQILLSGQSPA